MLFTYLFFFIHLQLNLVDITNVLHAITKNRFEEINAIIDFKYFYNVGLTGHIR